MKSKRLGLKDLQVKSFVTNMEEQKGETVKGGNHVTCPMCVTVNSPGCTLDDACFTVGPHCSYAQIC